MLVWVVILTAALIYLPWVMTSHSIFGLHLTRHELLNMNMTQINYTLIYIVGALGLNLLTGYTGLISIGNAAFYAIGAMVAASIGIKWLQLPFLVVVLAAGIAGAIVGAVVGLPALRIRGIYLLLGTLGAPVHRLVPLPEVPGAYFGIVGVDLLVSEHRRLEARQRQELVLLPARLRRARVLPRRRTSCARATGAPSSPSATIRSPRRRRGSTSPTCGC